MAAQRKVFRIEENLPAEIYGALPAVATDGEAAQRHHELMTEIMMLRALLNPRAPPIQEIKQESKQELERETKQVSKQKPSPETIRETGTLVHEQIGQAYEFKGELDLIREAIRRTKQDIGGLEVGTFIGPQMARVGQELDAVIDGTEQATQKILKSAEDIDQIANNMSSLLKGEYAQGLAQDVRDHVVKIFEACNFQDLTGQRIGKVVATLKFIEEHINRMQEIWNSIESAVPVVTAAPATTRDITGESKLLNGPKLDDDPGHASQADIDVIFDSN
jgi:chemotaxis protein CheZ